jgi:hypothetical protein
MKLKLLAAALVSAFGLAHAQSTLETRQINSAIKQGGIDLAWSRVKGTGITIGIIDQGFDQTHADISRKITASRNFYTGGPVTWGIHGTQMASIAAGALNGTGTVGVAPEAGLLLAQVGSGGSQNILRESAIYAALDWLSASGAQVINMSMGANYTSTFIRTVQTDSKGNFFANSQYGVNYGATNAVLAEFSKATNRGSIIVVSAGNQGLPYASFPAMFASRTDPSNKLVLGGRMIVVGAVDNQNNIASFSNRAGHLCQNSSGTTCKDTYLTRDFFVVAPGVGILAATPNQLNLGRDSVGTSTGTSPAAAYVSGGMALIKQAWPQLRSEQLVNLVLTTTKDLGAPGTDNVYGRGLVDFNRASNPQGQLVVAAKNYTLGTGTVYGIGLQRTAAMGTSGFSSALQTSEVLRSTQVLDDYGRNYTADLTKAVITRQINTNPTSPWLGHTQFTQAVFDISDQTSVTVYPGQTGSAAEITYKFGTSRIQLQSGSMSESNGFLGNYGSGAMSLGSSSTQWTMLGFEQSLYQGLGAFGQLGFGKTNIVNDPMSIFTISDTVLSKSWRVGLNKDSVLIEKDRLQFSMGSPVTITSGQAQISTVVGYDYQSIGDDNYNAVPIIAKETINLTSNKKLYTMSMNYQGQIAKNLFGSFGLAHTFNSGTWAGINLSFTN